MLEGADLSHYNNSSAFFVSQCYPCIEIAIKQCRNGGIDCKIHALSIVGKKRTSEGQLPTALSFLASDNDDTQV
jgi:E3 ubiquitin-protein ligase HERC2